MSGNTFPGEILGLENQFVHGNGTYVHEGKIYASLAGKIIIEDLENQQRISIFNRKNQREAVIGVGDKVICRVLRLQNRQANVEILTVGEREFRLPPKGIIRKEDVRLTEIDKVVIHDCFRPGDFVKAIVISMGDSRQYYLSTAEAELGVCLAKSQISNEYLEPISWMEMNDPTTKTKELRKVAKP